MEQTDDIEKQIELKRLEIEKLKLEKELHSNSSSTLPKEESIEIKDAYPNKIALNIFILIVASVGFYLLPWGSLNSSYQTNLGGGGSSMSFTGFNIGLFTYSYPLTIVNIVLLVLIALNKLKPVGIVGVVALLISFVAVANAFDFSKLSAGYSSQFGSVSAGIKPTGWCYILPVSYLVLVVINIAESKRAFISPANILEDKEADMKALSEARQLEREQDNNLHYIDSKRYLTNLRIELLALIGIGLVSYFQFKGAMVKEQAFTWYLYIASITGIGFWIVGFIVQFYINWLFIRNSYRIALYKLYIYIPIAFIYLIGLFTKVFLNYTIIQTSEWYLIIANLALTTLTLIAVINERESIQFDVYLNSNTL